MSQTYLQVYEANMNHKPIGVDQAMPIGKARRTAKQNQKHDCDGWLYVVQPLANDRTLANVAVFDENNIFQGYLDVDCLLGPCLVGREGKHESL